MASYSAAGDNLGEHATLIVDAVDKSTGRAKVSLLHAICETNQRCRPTTAPKPRATDYTDRKKPETPKHSAYSRRNVGSKYGTSRDRIR